MKVNQIERQCYGPPFALLLYACKRRLPELILAISAVENAIGTLFFSEDIWFAPTNGQLDHAKAWNTAYDCKALFIRSTKVNTILNR